MEDVMLDGEVRSRLIEVLERDLGVEEFQDWLVSAGWGVRTALVAQLDHLFAERSLLTDEEFRSELAGLAATFWITEPHAYTFGLSNVLVEPGRLSFGGDVTIRQHLAFVGS